MPNEEMTQEDLAILAQLEAEEAAKNEPVEAVMLEGSVSQPTLFQNNVVFREAAARPVLPTGEVRGGVHKRTVSETTIRKGISLR